MVEEEDESLDALEFELNQMGLSVEDLQPPEDGHFDRRAMARVESARIMSRRFIERDRVKDRISNQTKVRGATKRTNGTYVMHETCIVRKRETYRYLFTPCLRMHIQHIQNIWYQAPCFRASSYWHAAAVVWANFIVSYNDIMSRKRDRANDRISTSRKRCGDTTRTIRGIRCSMRCVVSIKAMYRVDQR